MKIHFFFQDHNGKKSKIWMCNLQAKYPHSHQVYVLNHQLMYISCIILPKICISVGFLPFLFFPFCFRLLSKIKNTSDFFPISFLHYPYFDSMVVIQISWSEICGCTITWISKTTWLQISEQWECYWYWCLFLLLKVPCFLVQLLSYNLMTILDADLVYFLIPLLNCNWRYHRKNKNPYCEKIKSMNNNPDYVLCIKWCIFNPLFTMLNFVHSDVLKW